MRGVPLRYSFRNLLRRPARTALTLLGLSLLVALIVFVMAFGRSFGLALRSPGDPQNLVILSKKAQSMEFSSIAPTDLALMKGSVQDDLQTGPDGKPLFSEEVFSFTNVRFTDDSEEEGKRAIVLGIDSETAPHVLAEFRLVQGRLPENDEFELAVGRGAASKMRAPESTLAIGSKVYIRTEIFEVVGLFEAPGTLAESWLLTTPNDLKVTMNRGDFSFARMKVKPSVDLDALATRLTLDESYQVRVLRETAYFADFVSGFGHFQDFSVLLAVILAVGGILTGMNTMHNAVSGRIREIGVLRVLGFGKGQVLIAFLIEALALSLIAGVIGGILGLLTNGLPMRLPFAATFPLVVDGPALAVGMLAAVLMGLLGLAFPIARALRHPAVDAVRAV